MTPEALYKSVCTTSLNDAIKETLTLENLKAREPEYGESEMHVMRDQNYATDFVTYAINKICSAYKRKDPMSQEERSDLAELILSRRGFLTIADLKLFVTMLLNNEIETGKPGFTETRLITVEASSIIEKLDAYVRKRDIVHRRMYGDRPSVTTGTERRRPFGDFNKECDAYGNVMPKGWDWKTYWTNYRNTHLLDGSVAPSGMNMEAYLTGIPEISEIEHIANRIKNVIKRVS